MKRPRHAFSGVMTVLVLAFLYLPLVYLFLNAFNADRDLVEWGGFTTQWFEEVLRNERIREDFLSSVSIAVCTMAISVVIALCGVLWARLGGPRRRMFLDVTTVMRIILPEVVIAVALFVALRRFELPLGSVAVIVGHVVFLSAYATVIVQARMATMGDQLEAAAADLGATPRRVFWRVTLPHVLPAVIVSALLVFTFSFDNVITSQFLSGGKVETLPVLLLGLIRHEVTPEVNAVGVIVIAITLLSCAAAIAVAGLRSAALAGGTPARRGEDR